MDAKARAAVRAAKAQAQGGKHLAVRIKALCTWVFSNQSPGARRTRLGAGFAPDLGGDETLIAN